MKEIITYTRSGINTTPDLKLFTAGRSGLMFTAVNASGLTLKAGLARGGTILLPSNPVGAGLGYGDSLLVVGTGDLLVTFWGELEETYRINGTALEVLVASPIPYGSTGTVGGVPVTLGTTVITKPGLYNDKVYRYESSTSRKILWS